MTSTYWAMTLTVLTGQRGAIVENSRFHVNSSSEKKRQVQKSPVIHTYCCQDEQNYKNKINNKIIYQKHVTNENDVDSNE